MEDAEQAARMIMQQATEAAEEKLAEAQKEAEAWWADRRAEDETIRSQLAEEGYREGYAAAAEQAEAEVWANWGDKLREAEEVVQQAYASKEAIVAESEAFVVELSCAIAGKILNTVLTEAPDMAMRLYAQALSRRKEQGAIVLCVSPAHFAFVQAAREEFVLSLDSQAELQIVPDGTVREGGCVVRSSFGSIDARIDTQLDEIREALLAVAAHRSEEGEAYDGA